MPWLGQETLLDYARMIIVELMVSIF